MVDLKPAEIVAALSEGKIDAASCFSPCSDAIKKNREKMLFHGLRKVDRTILNS